MGGFGQPVSVQFGNELEQLASPVSAATVPYPPEASDVIPPHTSAVTEIVALLRLAWQNGFVGAALVGLARTLFSDYRALRQKLGLTHYSEAEMLAVLAAAGFSAHRRYPNLEHNQERRTFVAEPVKV